MSKYKYFLKVTYSYGILEENAEKEEAYQELERLADRGVTEAEYRKILQDAYGEGKISLAEMRRLLQKFQK